VFHYSTVVSVNGGSVLNFVKIWIQPPLFQTNNKIKVSQDLHTFKTALSRILQQLQVKITSV